MIIAEAPSLNPQGAECPVFLMTANLAWPSGWFFGSDSVRSPLHRWEVVIHWGLHTAQVPQPRHPGLRRGVPLNIQWSAVKCLNKAYFEHCTSLRVRILHYI